jgi:hypothetical protein
LLEQPPLDIYPAPVQGLGSVEPLDLHDRVWMIDHQLVAAAVVRRPHLAPDDAVGPAEETHHAFSIGTAKPGNRGQNRGNVPRCYRLNGRSIVSRGPKDDWTTDT